MGEFFMDDVKKHEVSQWLIKSIHDVRSAQRLFSDNPPLRDTAVYHCQQAMEKGLKAFLTLNETVFPKTHLLTVLLEQCIEIDHDFEELRDAAEILTPYATAFRYPGDYLEPSDTEAQEAIELADLALKFVMQRMPHEILTFVS
jgi:HEPN domain-containing protein